MKSTKILVTGKNGQLGSELNHLSASYQDAKFEFVDLDEMDLSKDQSIQAFFKDKIFDFVIHCAAYTAVDKAEQESDLAFRINAQAVKTIAQVCEQKKMRMIYISTDYVFDGNKNILLNELEVPNPVSVYGKSKLEGENHVREILKDAYIIRTAWVYSSFGKNFVKTILNLASQKPSLNIVADQIGSPTYARDLAAAILGIIESIVSRNIDQPGTYHYSNEGAISWFDFAAFIVSESGLKCKLIPITTKEYPTAATRPAFSVMDKRKIKNTFNVSVPYWHESLKKCLQELQLTTSK